MTGAQFEISIDGVPRTYRDQKELALLAAQILKSSGEAERLEDWGRDRRCIQGGAIITERSRCRSSLDWLKVKNPAARRQSAGREEDWR